MNYTKPVVMVNDDVAEGVYTASGDEAAICWSATAKSTQDWNGSQHVFEATLVHTTDVEHISLGCTVEYSFDKVITAAESENGWECKVSGNTVTVTRPSHANAYNSGDNVTYKIWVKSLDEAMTKAVAFTGAKVISCNWTTNVQGGGANGT